MEREYLVEGAIVIFVLVVISLIFLSSNAEIRKDIGNIVDDVFGFGKEKEAKLEGAEAFDLWKSSLEECSGDRCACKLVRGRMVGGYSLFLKNTEEGASLLLFSSDGEILKRDFLDSTLIGLMKRVAVKDQGEEEYLVCELKDAMKLNVDSEGYWQVTESIDDFNYDFRIYGGPDIRGLMSLGDINGKKVLCLLTKKIESRSEFMDRNTVLQLGNLGLVKKINYTEEDKGFLGAINFEGAAKRYLRELPWCSEKS